MSKAKTAAQDAKDSATSTKSAQKTGKTGPSKSLDGKPGASVATKAKPVPGKNGGARPGGGRKPGSPNKRTAEIQKAVEESGLTPLEYMLQVMRDGAEEPKTRLHAASQAAPYVHAKLSTVELTGKNGGAVEITTIERVIVDPVASR